jgi:fimbrial chaperone protein
LIYRRGTSEIIRVENTYTTPLPVELRVYEAEYTDSGIKATERTSNDLLVFPPQALIAPGRTQTFRIQYVGDTELARSRHFIVTVAQLPVELPKGDSTVQILYDFNVVVGVALPGAKAALRIARAESEIGADGKARPALYIENAGSTYGYLANGSLKIVQRDAAGHEVFNRDLTDQQVNQEIGLGLVGPGQTRRLVAPIILPQTGGTVEARFTPSRH